jgi:hypothetical protein
VTNDAASAATRTALTDEPPPIGLVESLRAIGRRHTRTVRDALVVIGILRAVWYFAVQGIHPWDFIGIDARAYWSVDLAHPYASSGVGVASTYLYSPAFAQVLAPFTLLPFAVFFALWTAAAVVVLIWLVRPWPWALGILALPIIYELMVGQVHLFIAAAIVVGFRYPAAWVLPILTKITPGIGLLWFPIRREWRAFGIAVGSTLAVVAVSALLSPGAWAEWFAFLTASTGRGDVLYLRIALGLALVAFGAMTNRPWFVPIAVWIALPVVWIESWVILLAIIRLRLPNAAPATTAGADAHGADRPSSEGVSAAV